MSEPTITAWEYRTVRLGIPVNDDAEAGINQRLNDLGELGWELVAVTAAQLVIGAPEVQHAYLKRRLR